MGHKIDFDSRLPETSVKLGEFAGKPFLAIHEIKNGEISERPVISFGLKKAKAVIAAIAEIEKFVEAGGN